MSAEKEPAHVFVLGEGGTVFKLDLPLPEGIEARLASGALKRVANAEGDPYEGDDGLAPTPPTEVPALSALKADWIAWAVVKGAVIDDAEAMTKQDLIDKYSRA